MDDCYWLKWVNKCKTWIIRHFRVPARTGQPRVWAPEITRIVAHDELPATSYTEAGARPETKIRHFCHPMNFYIMCGSPATQHKAICHKCQLISLQAIPIKMGYSMHNTRTHIVLYARVPYPRNIFRVSFFCRLVRASGTAPIPLDPNTLPKPPHASVWVASAMRPLRPAAAYASRSRHTCNARRCRAFGRQNPKSSSYGRCTYTQRLPYFVRCERRLSARLRNDVLCTESVLSASLALFDVRPRWFLSRKFHSTIRSIWSRPLWK